MSWIDDLFSEQDWGAQDPYADQYDASYYDPTLDQYDWSGGGQDLADVYASLGAYEPSTWELPSYEMPAYQGAGVDFALPESAQQDIETGFNAYGAPKRAGEALLDYRGGERAPQAEDQARWPRPESAVTRAIRGVVDRPGGVVQTATGLGSLAAIGSALASKRPKVTYQRNVLPAEQAAQAAMAEARAKASGTLATRGYAGEEGIRETVNEQIQAALEGNMDLASPETTRMLAEKRQQLEDRLRQEIGPGFMESTAGQNALRNFEIQAEAILDAERESRLATRNQMGMTRSQFARQLELDPFQMAQAEMGTLANIGTEDARMRYAAEATGAAEEGADRRALLGLGGNLAGMSVAPWLYQAMLASVPRRSAA